MDSNSYPTFQGQNNNSYNYTSFAPQNTQSEPILVGVPVSANKGQAQYPNLQPAIPMPTGAQPTFNYGQIPQASSQFVSPQMGVLHQPRNNHINPEKQNKGYVELANAQNFEKTYHTEDMSQENLNIAQGVAYPHLPGPMVTPDPQFAHITAEMHPPIVYDPSLLNTINSREPQIALCQRCNKRVQTIVKYEIGTGTLISSCFLAMFGALPCAWVPCCMKDLKDAVHICPVCGGQIGVKKFMVN